MVALRQAAATFARMVAEQRQDLLSGAASLTVVQQVREDISMFMLTAAWKTAPAEVKRSVMALRDALKDGPPPPPDALRTLLEPCGEKLAALVSSMAEPLDAHDREVWAECSARLAQVELHLAIGATGGSRIFSEALEAAEALGGRDPRLDGWLRQARKLDASKMAEAELREELAHFKEQLEVLPFH
jgi:hypothetical protein